LVIGKIIGRDLLRCCGAAILGFTAISAPARSADPGLETADRIAVLDAGTFLRVEAHNATLGEMLDRLKAHLKIEVSDSQILDLTRVVEGSKTGTPLEIMQWLAPGASFILIFDRPKPGEAKPGRLERIGFLGTGAAPPSAIASAAIGKPVDPIEVKPPQEATPSPSARSPARGNGLQSTPSAADLAAGKPDIPSTPKTEIKTVAEQLDAQTPTAQLAIEAAARNPGNQIAPPAFLAPQSDGAQLSIEQQMERSQALATEQLRALMEAYRAVRQGRTR
jgi:hypothetical protein